jgi:hypothetical protein
VDKKLALIMIIAIIPSLWKFSLELPFTDTSLRHLSQIQKTGYALYWDELSYGGRYTPNSPVINVFVFFLSVFFEEPVRITGPLLLLASSLLIYCILRKKKAPALSLALVSANFMFQSFFEPGFVHPLQLCIVIALSLMSIPEKKLNKYINSLAGLSLTLTWVLGFLPALIIGRRRNEFYFGLLAGLAFYAPFATAPTMLSSSLIPGLVLSNDYALIALSFLPLLLIATLPAILASLCMLPFSFPFSILSLGLYPKKIKKKYVKFFPILPAFFIITSLYFSQTVFFARPNGLEVEGYAWLKNNTQNGSRIFDGVVYGNLISTYGGRANFGDPETGFMGYAPDRWSEEYQSVLMSNYKTGLRRVCTLGADYLMLHLNPERYGGIFELDNLVYLYIEYEDYYNTGNLSTESQNMLVAKLLLDEVANFSLDYYNDEIAVFEVLCD